MLAHMRWFVFQVKLPYNTQNEKKLYVQDFARYPESEYDLYNDYDFPIIRFLRTEEFLPSLNLNEIRTKFSFGAVEDPKWIVIRTAIIQTGFSPHGARSSTRLDLLRTRFNVLLLMEFSARS